MNTIIVTGGAGFIGSHFIKSILSRVEPGIKIVNVDKLTYAGNLNNLSDIDDNSDYVFIKQDICDYDEMKKIFKSFRPDYIINFAAETHVDRSIADSNEFIRSNVMGVQILLQCALDSNIKKIVQVSTDEVYGPSWDGESFTEKACLMPRNPYAASKAAADLLVLSFYSTYGLPVNISRCTNNYGPGQHGEKFIPKAIANLLKGKAVPIYGDGRQARDWLYVEDHCRALESILFRGEPGEIYNISSYNPVENIELIKLIISYMKDMQEGSLGQLQDLIAFIEDRKGHDRRYSINSQKIRTDLGWEASMPFEKGLYDTIRWYVKELSK